MYRHIDLIDITLKLIQSEIYVAFAFDRCEQGFSPQSFSNIVNI